LIIPAFEPGAALTALVRDFSHEGFPIVVVDDGSGESFRGIFEELKSWQSISVLRHPSNLGKGQAIKTALRFYLAHRNPLSVGVITADADGQHATADVLEIARQFTKSPDRLWLGVRPPSRTAPWRSRIGNQLSRYSVAKLAGVSLVDTQTGLRGIPLSLIPRLLKIPHSRYEFELAMLLLAIDQRYPIAELPIQTIYRDRNKCSHFRPLLDSLLVYSVFWRYAARSFRSQSM
jgi:glycosyltransferase involved in cell wall biosynthesis